MALRTPGSAKALQKEVAGLLSRQVLVQAGQPQALLFHPEHLERVGRFVQRQLEQQHQEFPEREGLPVAALQGKLQRIFPLTGVSEGLLKFFERQQLCSRRGEFYALPSHQAQQGKTAVTQLEALLELLKEGAFNRYDKHNYWNKLAWMNERPCPCSSRQLFTSSWFELLKISGTCLHNWNASVNSYNSGFPLMRRSV